ncbi:MAG TPA: pyridoxal-phosphate dependent enzyme [Propylenella sp.]
MRDELTDRIADTEVYRRAVGHFRKSGITLPTFGQLIDPTRLDKDLRTAVEAVDADEPAPLNLFRVHWFNDAERKSIAAVPGHVVLPSALTGVAARIIVAIGSRFPMIHAHKVLAAYACLAPRIVTGRFDPTSQRAVWPSTGNYCRGGVAISRILGCRGLAILPEGMSRERFDWLEAWVADKSDIHRTPGSESNVKEIYDACNALAKDPDNVILNQFAEFGNYIVHRAVTGPALEKIIDAVRGDTAWNARAFVAASGSAGTLAAGDYLKERHGTAIAVVEAAECPTLLLNGYGEHNIQGIGDKHVPLIHNVLNTDYVIGVSDRSTDALNVLFNTAAGRAFLARRKGLPAPEIDKLSCLGLSGIANVIAAIKLARYMQLGAEEAVITVATDDATLYRTELEKSEAELAGGPIDEVDAAEIFGRHLAAITTDNLIETTRRDRERMFNLGYYTWVEQQNVSLADFDRRRDQAFWDDLMRMVPAWDRLIERFNAETSGNM